MNEESIFAVALEKKSPAERKAFLDESCRGNAELRAQVEELLSASAAAGSFFEHPPAGLDVTVDVADHDTHKPANWDGSLTFLKPCGKPDRIGKLVGNSGEYEIVEVVGSGGMGIVLRAFDAKLSRVVAVKVLAPELARNPTAVKRFLREAKAAAAVVHDHVVTIHNVEESHQPPFLVMQFVDGQTLQQKIDRVGALELKEILRIGTQAASGLAAAHKHGLVHRDVKPANILLENGVERVKITDFGLARAADDVEITQTGLIAGTPQYMSPEQAKGDPVDARSDLFSLGSVLYTMCTGRPPFRAETTMGVIRRVCDDAPRAIREVNPEIPPWLEAIVGKLLAKNPNDRYETATEVSGLLGQCLAHAQNPSFAPLPAIGSLPPASSQANVPPVVQKSSPSPSARRFISLAIEVSALIVLAVTITIGFAPSLMVGLGVALFASAAVACLTLLTVRLVRRRTGGTLASPATLLVVLAQVLLVPVAAAMVLVIALAPRHLGWGWGVILMAAALVTCLTLRIARITRRKPIDELPHKPSQPLQKPPPGHARRLNTAAAVALMVLVGAALGMALLFAFGVAGMVAWYSHRRDTPQQFPIIGPAQIETTSADQLEGYAQGQWVSLFDGQSLAGWKAIPEQHWQVKDGVIHGSGPDAFLLTSAADFEDFHLLVEFRINEAGDSGVHFRIPTPSAESGPHWGYRVTGMEAEIGINKEPGHRTGALTVKDPEGRVLAEAPPPSHKADEWTRMEVIARRQRIQILVNGKLVTDYQDPEQEFRNGHIALASWEHAGIKTAVEFRKVEVRSLTPAAEWKPLFNGTDLRGWTMHPESSSAWTVKDNLLVGLGPNQYLYSERGDYQDFILRAEAQINAAGDGGVLVRMAPPAQPPAAQSGYEVQLAADPNHVSPTATIIRHGASVTSKDAVPQSATGRGDLIRPDEWFSLELAVIGGHLSVAIDGRQVVSYRDEGLRANGYIALQSFAEGSELSFRKIEIQELSAEGGIVLSSDAAPPPALAPFDAAQAAFHRDAWAAHLDVPAEISNSLGMKFRLIPPGGFTMGSGATEQQSALANMEQSLRRVDAGDEKGRVAYVEYLRPLVAAEGPAHRVTLTRPYYIGTTEVTAAQFGRFVHATGHVTSAERSADGGKVWGRVRHESSKEFHWRNPCRRPRTPEHPVTQVSHEDALAFCRWLSEKEGIEYDLPTEAQWEFACRAGSDTPWSFGSDPAEIDEHAWADMDIALSLTEFTFHEAGRKAANAFGLYDMHGNVQEWCKDWWSATAYSVRAEVDPTGPAAPDAESNRVVRGGAIFLPHDLRSAIRRRATADYAENGLGFRVVIVGNLQAIRPAAIAWGPVRDGWQVGLGWKEGKQRYAAGDKVEFELKVRNATDAEKTIRIVEPGHWDLWYSGDNDLSIRIFGRDEQDVKLAPREEKAIDVPKPQIDLACLAGGTYRVKVTTDVVDAKHQPPDGDFGFQYDGPAEPPFAAPMDPLRHPDDQYAAIAWGRPVLGLSLGIREAERQDAAGEQTLEFFLWNAGSGPANIEYLEHHPLDWQLVLRDQDGQELESEPILTGPKVQANQQLAAGEVLPLGSTPLSRQWLSGRRPVGGLSGSHQAAATFNCRRLDYGQLNLRLTSGEATAEMKP